jgi:hypothetical protein
MFCYRYWKKIAKSKKKNTLCKHRINWIPRPPVILKLQCIIRHIGTHQRIIFCTKVAIPFINFCDMVFYLKSKGHFTLTVAVYCENRTEHTDKVRSSQETHYVSATENNRLKLFGETAAVYY